MQTQKVSKIKASSHKSHPSKKGKKDMSAQEHTPAEVVTEQATPNAKKNAVSAEQTGTPMKVAYSAIIVDKAFNVRKDLSQKAVDEMIAGIGRDGLSTPLEVRTGDKEGTFLLTKGFTRYEALGALIQAGRWKGEIPVLLKDYKDPAFALLANLAENTNRKSVRTYDQAERCAFLETKCHIARKHIAESAGVDSKHIGLLVRCYTKLHPSILAVWENPSAQAEIPLNTLAHWSSLAPEEQLVKYEAYLKELLDEGEESVSDGAAETAAATPAAETGDDAIAAKPPTKNEVRAMLESLVAKVKETNDETQKAYIKALKWVLGDKKVLR